jgi:ATP-binding cassette subfamily E protein 1
MTHCADYVCGSSIRVSDLGNLLERNIEVLSGGELQRFAIALTCVQKGDVYV